MYVVLEILNEEGYDNMLDDPAFTVEQLGWMEKDRAAGGYVTLDGTNYVMPVRIVGVARHHATLTRDMSTEVVTYTIDPLKDPE